MRILSLVVLSLILAVGCATHKKTEIKDVIIEYSAHSRGLYQNILVANQSVVIANSREGNPIKFSISDNDWKAITTELKKINASELSRLKAPTEKRFYDGAAIAQLKITQDGISYETPSFDHGFPPTEIQKLVTMIVALNKK